MDQISAHFLSSVQELLSQLGLSSQSHPIRSAEINKPMAFIPPSCRKQELTTPTGSRGLTCLLLLFYNCRQVADKGPMKWQNKNVQ